jgi:hypothetical protein
MRSAGNVPLIAVVVVRKPGRRIEGMTWNDIRKPDKFRPVDPVEKLVTENQLPEVFFGFYPDSKGQGILSGNLIYISWASFEC